MRGVVHISLLSVALLPHGGSTARMETELAMRLRQAVAREDAALDDEPDPYDARAYARWLKQHGFETFGDCVEEDAVAQGELPFYDEDEDPPEHEVRLAKLQSIYARADGTPRKPARPSRHHRGNKLALRKNGTHA